MRPDGWSQARRILALRLDNIGDVIMTGPALRALRAALPHAHITLMVSRAGAQVAPLLPWVDAVSVQRVLWQDASASLPFDPAREYRLIDTLRAGRFDAALIFTSFSQSAYPPAYVCYLAGIPLRAGQARDFGGGLLTHRARLLPDSAHQVDRNLHLVESLGFAAAGHDLELAPPAEATTAAARLLARVGIEPDQPFIALAPGATCAARRYAPQRFRTVARVLARQAGLPVVLVGSASDAGLVGAADGEGVFSLLGATSLPELVAVIARASLVITNNSGPMHIADAVNRPMVVLFSGTELESQWRPRRAPARLLNRSTSCAPCYGFTCPHAMECLDVPPEEVVEAGLDLLARTTGPDAAIPCVQAGCA